jgi:hypothetical protein
VVLNVLAEVAIKSFIFWDIIPCSLIKVNGLLAGICHLDLQGSRVDQARNSFACYLLYATIRLVYPSTLKMEVTCSSETTVYCHQATRRYIREGRSNS